MDKIPDEKLKEIYGLLGELTANNLHSMQSGSIRAIKIKKILDSLLKDKDVKKELEEKFNSYPRNVLLI
jgi:hypothetical protein